ncbi:MAG: hypothetical protein RSF32_03250 [Raoultibacter sp.]
MDAMVTARVPVEKKEKVDALLREAGATATQLVNAAYDYYLERGEIPLRAPKDEKKELQRRLTLFRSIPRPLPAFCEELDLETTREERLRERFGEDYPQLFSLPASEKDNDQIVRKTSKAS